MLCFDSVELFPGGGGAKRKENKRGQHPVPFLFSGNSLDTKGDFVLALSSAFDKPLPGCSLHLSSRLPPIIRILMHC